MSLVTNMTLAEELKERTSQAHTLVERHPVNHALIQGALGLEGYAEYLGQWLGIHAPLEAAVAQVQHTHPAFAGMVKEYHFRVSALISDLYVLGKFHWQIPITEQVVGFADRTRELLQSSPITLLGFLYVLEGSTNGGLFLAEAVKRAYGPATESATRYLNPHGRLQRDRWKEFKDGLNALPLSDDERSRVVEGALEMFTWVGRVFDDLAPDAVQVRRRAMSAVTQSV